MTVPSGLADDAVRMDVVKLDRRTMAFGDYQVQNIRRGWEGKGGLSIGGVSASQKRRDFSFLLTQGDVTVSVTCELEGSSTSVGSFKVDGNEQVLCDVASGSVPWKLVLVGEGNRKVRGSLRQGGREIQIQPAHSTGWRAPRGYFVRDGQEVAAVDVGRKSRTIYLRNALAPDLVLALAASTTALMIYEEVASHS
ncbi:MAG: hypothetical protein AB1Z98_27285 [Nannocystaceae bacterium]